MYERLSQSDERERPREKKGEKGRERSFQERNIVSGEKYKEREQNDKIYIQVKQKQKKVKRF